MAKSGQQRQREYKERQRKQGKIPMTIMLSKEAYDILKSMKKPTGESFSAVIDRIVATYKKPVTTTKKKITTNVTANSGKSITETQQRIVEMYDQQGLSFAEIARRFDAEGLPTISRRGKWSRSTVGRQYKKAKGI